MHADAVQIGCDQKQDDLQIREMVGGLKETSRVVLSLYYFEQLSVGEISDALRIPSGTVKS
jgi:DNA-directed RNA polymerase specialized sigma24 family protein